MLLQVYELIRKMEERIGNGAYIRMGVSPNTSELLVRVYWDGTDIRAERRFMEQELFTADDILIDRLVDWCRKSYDLKRGK